MKEYTLKQLLKDLRRIDEKYMRLCIKMETEKDTEKNPLAYHANDEIMENLVMPVYVLAKTYLYMRYFGLPEQLREKLEIKKR